MKIRVIVPCSIRGFVGEGTGCPTWVNRQVSALVRLPTVPRVGEVIFFGNLLAGLTVARVEWFWTEKEIKTKGVLHPRVVCKRKMLDWLPGHTIEKTVRYLEDTIRNSDELFQWNFEPTTDPQFLESPRFEH